MRLVLGVGLILAAVTATAQQPGAPRPVPSAGAATVPSPAPAGTPASAPPAFLQRLEKSPRHQEWVSIKSGERNLQAFLVYPERKDKALAVVVIHENRGLTDWVRSVADQLAEAGVLAIAPDLLSGAGPGGGKTADFPSSDAAREALGKLPAAQVMADLQATSDYVTKLPAANGTLAAAGFCWGGAQTFRFATERQSLSAAFVFYGTAPTDKDTLARITAPVYGFYGESDARVNATLVDTARLMRELGKTFESRTYDGAGHGFMRAAEEPNASVENRKAHEGAWRRWRELLASLK